MTGLMDHVADAGITTRAAVLAGAELGLSLRPVLPVEWGAVRDVQMQVLQHHPGKRCTLSIGLCMTSGRHDLIGKVWVDIAQSNPKVVYAQVEAKGAKGGLYRSADAGLSWTNVNSSQALRATRCRPRR